MGVVIDRNDLECQWCVVFTTLWDHEQMGWRLAMVSWAKAACIEGKG